ncbi:DUF2726 domain-containing protein [Escherichia coli]|nr:DUF2726 domain-containing protein [Escherichia coli]EFM4019443.1 DUF2726 domain-containing protein [Escherichia coli]
MISQWHVDVVIVERRSFSIVATVDPDDASHLRSERRCRDILLEEVLRQASIPLLSCPTPETGKSKFPRSRRFCNKNRQMGVIVSNRECGIIAAGV